MPNKRIDLGLSKSLNESFKAPSWSPWQAMVNVYHDIAGNPENQAAGSQEIPAPPNPEVTPVNPYMNFSNKATGKQYR